MMSASPLPLVLVHGWGMDGRVWDSVLAQRSFHRSVIVVNLGFVGESAPAILPEQFIGVGHSYGVMWLLRHHARALRALVSVCGFTRFARHENFPAGTNPAFVKAMRHNLDMACLPQMREFWQYLGRAQDFWQIDELHLDATRLRQGLDDLLMCDVRQEWSRLDMPTLALAARDDVTVAPDLSTACWKDSLSARLVFSPQGGHLLPLTRPDWVASEIDTFLHDHRL